MERRGYLPETEKLEDFEFPKEMIAARSVGSFPDIVLRANSTENFTGGELIEIKSAKTYSISSFNSTFPTKTKAIDQLAQKIQQMIRENDENPDELIDRDVYYLLFGRNQKVKPAPNSKMCLVSGAFFDTMSTPNLIRAAFGEMIGDSIDMEDLESKYKISDPFYDQSRFASTRKIEGASVKIRFRLMLEAKPEVNLLSKSSFSLIEENTVNFISPFLPHDMVVESDSLFPWAEVPLSIANSKQFFLLDQAYDDINSELKEAAKIGIITHPISGERFFLAQARMRP